MMITKERTKMVIDQVITDFVTLAIENGGWMTLDRIYLQNRVLALIGKATFELGLSPLEKLDSLTLVDQLLEEAKKNQVIDGTQAQKEQLEAQLMDLLTPPPSALNAMFTEYYQQGPQEATDYFYRLCRQNNYIKTRELAKNVAFPVQTEYGELEITINLSKPEKDPKEIAAAKSAVSSDYPRCLLCMENEGYLGRVNHPARTNHRIIRMNLDGENWGLQYSPYAYYPEHCIILNEKHQPMKIDRTTFECLLTIVALFPHYFAGSNADLPIVGGSILSHDHYQGGRHEFPMAKAPIEKTFSLMLFPEVQAGIVRWPMSVIRLRCEQPALLVAAAEWIRKKWENYSDETLQIRAYDQEGVPHHTITPIARYREGAFELDLVLRDNQVSEEYPDGIFHPHPDVQHIKKENIGLIEVMGLAILPPRLKAEMEEVKRFLLDQENQIADYHLLWAQQLKTTKKWEPSNATSQLQEEIGKVFVRVLEDAGVYKRDKEGQAGFERLIQELNQR